MHTLQARITHLSPAKDFRILEQSLLQRIETDVAATRFVSNAAISCSHDRWLVSSQLQKAIRRSHDGYAIAATTALVAREPEYFWRRLRTIAMEDIGVGDPNAVAEVIAIAGKRSLHHKWGLQRTAVAMTLRLVRAVKNRTACDVSSVIDVSPHVDAVRAELRVGRPEWWVEIAVDQRQSLLHRAMSLQLLGGATVKTPVGFRAISKREPERLREMLDALNLPDILRYLVLSGHGTESLNTAIPLAFEYLGEPEAAIIKTPSVSDAGEADIGGVMASAYCRYTRAGNLAFTRFLKADRAFADTVRQMGATSPSAALGWLVFQTEGCQMDRSMESEATVRLRNDVEALELSAAGVTRSEDQQALRVALAERHGALNEARTAVARVQEGRVSEFGAIP